MLFITYENFKEGIHYKTFFQLFNFFPKNNIEWLLKHVADIFSVSGHYTRQKDIQRQSCELRPFSDFNNIIVTMV